MAARAPIAVHDGDGGTLTIAGAGGVIDIHMETRSRRDPKRMLFGAFTIDDDEIAIQVAHELLERAMANTSDCDEVTAAVDALRALAVRCADVPATVGEG